MYSRNRQPFSVISDNHFGRRIIETNLREITKDNIVKELGKALSIHYKNREEIDYLDRYYRGDQPILYRTKEVRPEINNKEVENHALEIVEFMTAQNFGEPIQYVSNEEDETVNKNVKQLNKIMSFMDKGSHDIELGQWQSICGTAYRYVWADNTKRYKFDFETADPRNCFVCYYSGKGHKPMYSCHICKDENNETVYYVYTEKNVFVIDKKYNISEEINGMARIPLIEYPNNSRRLSDIEIVITLLDSMNKIASNRMDGIEQFVQSFMKFVNCEISEDDFLKMCKLGAIKVKSGQGVNSDVDVISNELNQEQTQVAKDDIYKNMLIIEGMPNREQNTGGDTGQAVYLRNGWDFAEQRAKLDEPVITKSEKKFLDAVFYIMSVNKIINLDIANIDIKITRNKTDNMLVKAQGLMNLLGSGINPLEAIKICGLFSDPEKVYLDSKEYLDKKVYTVQQKEQTQPTTGGEEKPGDKNAND